MTDSDHVENNGLSVNSEDDEMRSYKKSAVSVVNFKIVYDEDDLAPSANKARSFKPDMAHQIFGESEMIFGYRQLSINLYYLHNSAKCYVDVKSSGQLMETETNKPDDIMKALNPWLPENYSTDVDEFKKIVGEEEHDKWFGEVLDTFEVDKKVYKITVCDAQNSEFKDFHQRFETYIVWFIDGANFIDIEDTRWTIFYVYEEYVDEKTNKIYRTPVALCTVYKFYLYPKSTRPRISQFFVLPTHQRKGIATKMYSAVVTYLKKMPDVEDITVEEPTETFQKIRDYCDSLYVFRDLEENKIDINAKNQKQINVYLKRHKIGKRQSQRVFDVLECLKTHKNDLNEYVKFNESIKARITTEIEKETKGSKRICNLDRSAVVVEPMDKKAAIESEYNKYINSLEWPVNRLRSRLFKSLST